MKLRHWLAPVLVLWLAACGGGGVPPSGNDLVVTGTGPTAPVAGGETATFTMTVRNGGPLEAKDVSLTSTVRGLVQTSVTYACQASGGATCPADVGPSMYLATLPVNGTLTFTVAGPVGEQVDGVISSTLRASASGDPDRSNDFATISGTGYSLQSNVVVSGSGPVDPVPGGGVATFTMVVANGGPQATGDVLIENRPGASSSLASLACSASGGATCPPSLNPIMLASAMPAGSALTFTVGLNVAKGYNGPINNTMSATVQKDPDKTNNIYTASGTADSANLSGSNVVVTGTGPAAPVAVGGTASFQMTVTNPGPQDAATMQVVNSVGAGAVLSGLTCEAAGGATCPAALGPSMQVSSFPVGGVLTFVVSAKVSLGSGGGTVKNTMSALLSNDPDRTNNLYTASGATYAADLEVKASGPTTNVKSGSLATFTMTVSNLGPDAAQDVAITNQVSDALTLTTIRCSESGGAICPPELGSEMSAPLIPAGGSLVFTVDDTVTAGTVGRVSNTMQVVAIGDPKAGNNVATASASASTANLGVSATVSERVAAGKTAYFVATVANAGPNLSQNVALVFTLPTGYSAGVVSCAPYGTAVCPASPSTTMTVPSLPVGGKLVFTIPVAVPSNARGLIEASWSASGEGDSDTSNNLALAATIAEDPRNGGYKLFSTDGRQYGMVLDFDAGAYTVQGHGLVAAGSFTADASGGGFTISGNQRWRLAEDMVVGGFDFGSGVRPFVAVRRFATTVEELTGTFNVSSLSLQVGSAPGSRVYAAQFAEGGLRLCNDVSQFYSMANCPSGSVWTYSLTVANGVYTAVDSVHGDTQTFYAARSGQQLTLLSAGDAVDSGAASFRIGLVETGVFGNATSYGASTDSTWDTVTVNSTLLTLSGVNALGESYSVSAPLAAAPQGPTGVRSGLRSSDQARVYLSQAPHLTVITGARNGAASGYLQISAP